MKTHVAVRIPLVLDARLEFRFAELPGRANASNRVLAALRQWAIDRNVPLDGIPTPGPAVTSLPPRRSRVSVSRPRRRLGRRRR